MSGFICLSSIHALVYLDTTSGEEKNFRPLTPRRGVSKPSPKPSPKPSLKKLEATVLQGALTCSYLSQTTTLSRLKALYAAQTLTMKCR